MRYLKKRVQTVEKAKKIKINKKYTDRAVINQQLLILKHKKKKEKKIETNHVYFISCLNLLLTPKHPGDA